jgi:hypothetical protein
MPRDQYSPQADAEPGYCPGFWYQIAAGQVAAGLSPGNNVLRMMPFQVRALVDIVALGGRIATLFVGGFCSFAIYRANGNTLLPMGRPMASTGPIATDLAVNVNGALVEGRVQLVPGLCWFAVMGDNTTAAFQTINSGANSALFGALTQDVISSAAANTVSYRQAPNPGAFSVWPNLTDPVLTAPITGVGYCLGQFQVAPSS